MPNTKETIKKIRTLTGKDKDRKVYVGQRVVSMSEDLVAIRVYTQELEDTYRDAYSSQPAAK